MLQTTRDDFRTTVAPKMGSLRRQFGVRKKTCDDWWSQWGAPLRTRAQGARLSNRTNMVEAQTKCEDQRSLGGARCRWKTGPLISAQTYACEVVPDVSERCHLEKINAPSCHQKRGVVKVHGHLGVGLSGMAHRAGTRSKQNKVVETRSRCDNRQMPRGGSFKHAQQCKVAAP